MGRMVLIAALVSLGVMGAVALGTWIGRRQARLEGKPRRLPALALRAGRSRDFWLGAGILLGLILIGFLIRSPTEG